MPPAALAPCDSLYTRMQPQRDVCLVVSEDHLRVQGGEDMGLIGMLAPKDAVHRVMARYPQSCRDSR